MDGHFEKGVYYLPQKPPIESTMVIKVEIEGYDEVKKKLKDLLIDAELILSATSRIISENQTRLEDYEGRD